jgi:hypothetical protein
MADDRLDIVTWHSPCSGLGNRQDTAAGLPASESANIIDRPAGVAAEFF